MLNKDWKRDKACKKAINVEEAATEDTAAAFFIQLYDIR